MIHTLVNEWLTLLNPLLQSTVLTKVYGLVRTGRVRVQNDRDYTFPLLLTQPATLVCDSYEDALLISDKQRCIVFVEGDTARYVPGRGRGVRQYSAALRVVVWYNETGYQNPAKVGPLLSSTILSALTARPPLTAGSGYQLLDFEKGDIIEGWRALSRYTFREETGFLLPPYKAFGIEGTLNFVLHENQDCNDSLLPVALVGNC